MKWYKSLSIHKRLWIKAEGFEMACGVSWEALGELFSMEERIEIFKNKLKHEGIIH